MLSGDLVGHLSSRKINDHIKAQVYVPQKAVKLLIDDASLNTTMRPDSINSAILLQYHCNNLHTVAPMFNHQPPRDFL